MSQIRKLAGETMIYGMGSVLPRILNFLLLAPYLTRVLEQSAYGIHGIMYSFSAMLLVFYTFRMETAFFRFGSKKEDFELSFTTTTTAVFVISIVLTSIILFISRDIASVLTRVQDQVYVQYFALIIMFDALSAIAFAKLRLQNRPIKFSILKLVNVLINIVIIVFLLELLPYFKQQNIGTLGEWYDPTKKLDYIFIANLVASGLIFLAILSEYTGIRFRFNKQMFVKMVRYASPLVIVGVAGIINQLVDRYLVKELLPGTVLENLAQSGIYNACVKIAVLMLLFTTAFNYAAEPFFFKNADKKDAPQIYARVGLAFAIVGSTVFLFISLYLDVFQYLIGRDFRGGLGIVPILLMAYLFLGMYYNFSIWYKLKDKTHYGAAIATVGSVVTLALNFILVPRIGYYGSSIAALACFAVMCIMAIYYGRKFYYIPYPLKDIGFIIFTAAGMFLVKLVLDNVIQSFILQLCISTIFMCIFVVIILFSQKQLIYELIGRTKK